LIQIQPSQVDLAKVKATLGAIKKNTDPVIYRAVNKSIGISRTYSINQVYDDLNLTKTYIRNRYKSKAGKWLELKAGPGRLKGQYWTIGKPIGLINFIGTKQLKNGQVSVKVKRRGTRFKLDHAFIAKAKGVLNVWEREPAARGGRRPSRTREQYAAFMESTYGRRWRLRLHRMAGPRIQDILADPNIYRKIDLHAVETFQRKLDEQLAYELNKL
jgi:hypothetical protein